MAGLFGTFTTSLRGLSVQQTALDTTSHNIANANTEGYSRQRAVIETTKPFGGMSRFDTSSVGQIGTGAEVTAIQRVRDQFIDYQIRSEAGTTGYYNSMSETLSKIDGIFGEPSDTSIQQLINNFFNVFSGASTVADKSDIKALAMKKAEALANAINYTYNKLEKSREDCQTTIKDSVVNINSTLNKINELNKQIRSVSAVGQTPNDLMDKRDNFIDELSSNFGIKIDRESFETINLSSTEYPNAILVKSNPTDIDYNRFSYVKSVDYIKDATQADGYAKNADGTYKGLTVEYYPLGNEKATVQSFDIVMPPTIPANVPADIKARKDLMNQLMQDRMLISDKNGYVGKTVQTAPTALAPASIPSIPPTSPQNNGDGTTTVTSSHTVGTGAAAVTTTTLTTSPTIETFPTTTTTVVIVTDSSGTTATQQVVQKLAPTTADELKARIFVSYDQEADSTGSLVNNVDINHVKGDIAANQEIQEKLTSYMDNLDRLAAGLAYSINAIQTGSVDGAYTSNGLENNLVFVTYNTTTKKNDITDAGITAKNLRVNEALLTDAKKLNFNTTSSSGDGDGKRATAFANLNTLKMNFSNVVSSTDLTKLTRKDFLTQVGINTAVTGGFTDATCLDLNDGTEGSTIDSYYRTIINNFATDAEEATTTAENEEARLADLKNQRTQVSGVSLDEEMANLIQFQHAYQANAKMISTIDELLDVVINGLKK